MDPEPVPSYLQCLTAIYTATKSFFTAETQDWSLHHVHKAFIQYCSVTRADFLLIAGLAVYLTCVRYLLTKAVFTPMAVYFKLKELNIKKFPESAWKFLYYGTAWSLCAYVLFSNPDNYFYRPVHIWEDWKPHITLDPKVYAVYMLQLAFYVHSVYASFFMDHWRKDTYVMVFHHILTIALITFSYATRYHKIGLLVLYLHDINDICLEFTKCNVYFKDRNKKFYAIHDYISVVGFLGFAGTWAVFRLYWFPLKVLYSACYRLAAAGSAPYAKFDFVLNALLWILQVLNVYWFMFILNFLYKVATGQMKEVDDVREEEIAAKLKKKKVPTATLR